MSKFENVRDLKVGAKFTVGADTLVSIRSATYKWSLSGLTSARTAALKWTASGSGTDEYYVELLAGGDPSISDPANVLEDGSYMTEGTMGSLTAGQYDYGDNDTLGYSTIYVRLTATGDPDSQAADFVQYSLLDEHYLELAAGGDPGLSEPAGVYEDGSLMTGATVGSLSAGEWDWGDNDTLGYDTVYVALTATGDPDAQAADFVTYSPTNALNVAVQFYDRHNLSELSERVSVPWYLSADAYGNAIAVAAPSGGIAIGTDGLLIEWTANLSGLATSEADGDLDVTLTETGDKTFYLVLVMPDGMLFVSGAIDFN